MFYNISPRFVDFIRHAYFWPNFTELKNAQFATKSTKKVSRSYVGFDSIKLKLICSHCKEKLDHFIVANNFFPVLSNSLAY